MEPVTEAINRLSRLALLRMAHNGDGGFDLEAVDVHKLVQYLDGLLCDNRTALAAVLPHLAEGFLSDYRAKELARADDLPNLLANPSVYNASSQPQMVALSRIYRMAEVTFKTRLTVDDASCNVELFSKLAREKIVTTVVKMIPDLER